jgi:drug/metabolite transporter (DMT)-like permease
MGWILGLISYFGWGTGDIFGVFSSRKIGAYRTTAYVYIFGFLLSSLYIPFAWSELGKITIGLAVINFLIGTAYLGGNLLLNEGFKRSNASLVGIIVSSFPALVLLLSTLIFKDPISIRQVFSVIVIFVGVFLCTVDFNDLKKGDLFKDTGIRFALVAATIFSVYFTFFRIFANQYGWFWANYISFASFPVVLFLGKKMFKYKENITFPKQKTIILATLCSALLLRGGDIALNYGLANGFSSIAAPLAGASPTLFVLLSSLFYKDPITKQQKIGIAVGLVGILFLSFLS